MFCPKISIIIPVYNGSNYLAESIDAALKQTYGHIEVIVVNDGSSDEGKTEEIALSYGDKIRYFSKPNGGVSSALNYGISCMTGEYFSWLSHDDLYSETKIEDAVELLAKHQQLGKKCVAFTGGHFIDGKGKSINKFHSYFEANRLYKGLDVVNIMTKKGTLNGCCMLIPKSAFAEVGGFDENLRYSQDSLMWYRIFLSEYSLVSDNKPNVMYRLHRKQTSQLRRDLFEHDSYVIAKLLAASLAQADGTGDIIYRYIKRLMKYQCKDAIEYLLGYADDNQLLDKRKRFFLTVSRSTGYARYRTVTVLKKILLWSRR